MEQGYDIEFTMPAPKIGFGKHKNLYVTANNIPYYWRYGITKIKHEFKENIRAWYLNENVEPPVMSAEIHYTILRNTGHKMDGDAFAYPIYKWIQDLLVELNYIIDDNACRVVLEPTRLKVKGVETSILVQVKLLKGK